MSVYNVQRKCMYNILNSTQSETNFYDDYILKAEYIFRRSYDAKKTCEIPWTNRIEFFSQVIIHLVSKWRNYKGRDTQQIMVCLVFDEPPRGNH